MLDIHKGNFTAADLCKDLFCNVEGLVEQLPARPPSAVCPWSCALGELLAGVKDLSDDLLGVRFSGLCRSRTSSGTGREQRCAPMREGIAQIITVPARR